MFVPRFVFRLPTTRQPGFTLTELIVILVVLGILAAVLAPRLIGTGFDGARFAQEVTSALRYAQNSAVSMQRTVCVGFAATTVTLRYANGYVSNTCDTDLIPPGGGPAPYQVAAQGSAAFSPVPAPVPSPFFYDRAGRPSSGLTLNLNDGRQIVVEAETGYVH